MNFLYGKATGKGTVGFPYKSVARGHIKVEGLPDEIYPVHPVSHF